MDKKAKSRLIDPHIWMFNVVKITSALPILISERLKKLYLHGKKPKGFSRKRIIVCANHRAYWDPVIVCALLWNRRVQFIATKELFRNKFSSWFFKRVGAIRIDRENVGINTFKNATKALDRGHALTIFPEASVSNQQSIRAFNPGAALMSVLCESDILPIYIAPRDRWYQRRVVVIGDRINPKQYISNKMPTLTEIQRLTDIIRKQEIKLKEVYDSWKK